MKKSILACLLAATLVAPMVAVPFAVARQQPAADPNATKALTPPTPGKPDDPPLVMNYLTMMLIIAMVVGANLIPSKRGHQD
ncbi:MAG: hypothetical protein NTV94_06160 [Planctomycetota bacterium]|nr:hypothetical protein [Planctomycetota bacterium]